MTDPMPPATDPAPPAGTGRSGTRSTLLLGLAVVVAFVVGAAGVSLLAGGDGPDRADGVRIDTGPGLDDRVAPTERQPLPEATLAGFGEGAEPVALAAYRGTPLIVNFWASWCAPCVAEMPDFERFSQEVGDAAPLLGVNVRDAPANARGFVERLGITYDLATDPDGDLYGDVRAFGMPTTLLVDADGMIVYRHTGPLDAAELRALAEEHLALDAR
jgi:cytochrome c biogenesis protein CcmG, thiol:disulfide interchange protein DsbE